MKSYNRSFSAGIFSAVVAVTAVACSAHQASPDTSTSIPAPSSSSAAAHPAECAASDTPLVTLEPKTADEPNLAIPTPQGWAYTAQLNSPMIRGALANKELRANDFTPNAVVTLEDLTGKVTSAQQGVNAEIASLEQGGMTVESRTPGSVCNHPSITITYTLQNRPVTALITAAENGPKTWAAIVTIQTTDPNNPAYVAGKTAILDGFQFTVPGNNH